MHVRSSAMFFFIKVPMIIIDIHLLQKLNEKNNLMIKIFLLVNMVISYLIYGYFNKSKQWTI